MSFGRRDTAAARAFLDSVYSSAGTRRGRGARHPSSWSDAYALRIANVWQRQAAAGRPLSLQEARRGPGFTERVRREQAEAADRGRSLRGGLEHPRQRFVGPRDARGRPDEGESVGFYARQYRRLGSVERWANRLTTDRVQIIAYGELNSAYSGDSRPGWRVMYTGDREAVPWDELRAGYAVREPGAAPVLVFDRVIVWEVRWGPGIGD